MGPIEATAAGYEVPPGSPSGPGTPQSPPATIGNVPLGAETIGPGPREQACEPARSSPTLHIGAKAILDNADFAQSTANRKAVGTEPDLTGFRFLRVMFYGDLAENIDYRLEVNLAQSAPGSTTLEAAFQDVWVRVRALPVMGNVKVGYFKEPFGLEQQTGEEYLLFMERSLPNAFVPARRIGIMAYNDLNDDKTLTWFTGTFREGSGDKTFLEYSDEGDFGTTTRLVWLPYYDPTTNGRYLVHLGAAYEFTGANNTTSGNSPDSKTFSFTPEINAQTNFGSVTIPCDTFQLFGAEAAVMDGPLLFMAEYMRTWMADTGLHDEDVFCDGGYAEVLYLITGENHNYVMNGKFFRGVDPYEPFFRVRTNDGVCSGWGAGIGRPCLIHRPESLRAGRRRLHRLHARFALVSDEQSEHGVELHLQRSGEEGDRQRLQYHRRARGVAFLTQLIGAEPRWQEDH